MSVSCTFCEKRRARRHCPGANAEICAPCCGTSREDRVDCPSTCEYLREARFHEAPAPIPDDKIPNKDVQLSEKFIREHEPLVFALSVSLKQGMLETKPGVFEKQAIDFDARQALDALIRTYRTLQSGLIYETRAQNPYAASIQEKLRGAIEEIQKQDQTLRDADVLGALVFLQRLEMRYNNGRPRGRAFRDFLISYVPDMQQVDPRQMAVSS